MPTSTAGGSFGRTRDDRSGFTRVRRVLARWAMAAAVMAAALVLFFSARAEAQCTCPPIVPSCPSGCVCSSSPATCGYTQGCGVRCVAGDTERVLGLCAGGTQTQYACTRSCGTTFTCTACLPGFIGPLCQYSNAVTCNGNGVARFDGGCVCNANFSGARCNVCATNYFGYPTCRFCNAATSCSGHGSCGPTGACLCSAGWAGASCNACQVGFGGPTCSRCPGVPTLCSGNGACSEGVSGTGLCVCNAGYAGAACQHSNSVTCNGHGTARADGSCVCDTGFAGVGCERCATSYFGFPSCRFCDSATTCGGAGTCTSAGLCACSAGYVSVDCRSPVIVSSSLGAMSGAMTLATITGHNFGVAGRVVANGVDALVSLWSDSSITFFVTGPCAMVDVTVVRMSDGRSSASWRLCTAARDAGAGDASGSERDVVTETDAAVDANANANDATLSDATLGDATLGDGGVLIEAGRDGAMFDSTNDDADAAGAVPADDARSNDAGTIEPRQDVVAAFDAPGAVDANASDAGMAAAADAGRPPTAGMVCSAGPVGGTPLRFSALWALAGAAFAASSLRRPRARRDGRPRRRDCGGSGTPKTSRSS